MDNGYNGDGNNDGDDGSSQGRGYINLDGVKIRIMTEGREEVSISFDDMMEEENNVMAELIATNEEEEDGLAKSNRSIYQEEERLLESIKESIDDEEVVVEEKVVEDEKGTIESSCSASDVMIDLCQCN